MSPDSSRMLVGAAVAAAVSLLGYSGFSNSRLQILQTEQRGAACEHLDTLAQADRMQAWDCLLLHAMATEHT